MHIIGNKQESPKVVEMLTDLSGLLTKTGFENGNFLM